MRNLTLLLLGTKTVILEISSWEGGGHGRISPVSYTHLDVYKRQCYLRLQSFRYGGTIQVEYEVEKEAESCLLPRLLLQPLVENAILHGIDLKKEDGRILIRAGIKDGLLRIDVSDNGRGMTREQIDTLLNSKVKKTSGLSAIGIPNIRDRLHLYYGEQGTIAYRSGDTGTTATVSLPEMRAGDNVLQGTDTAEEPEPVSYTHLDGDMSKKR